MDETCTLLAPLGGCRWCGSPLPAGRRRWCSAECSDGFADQHYWTRARERRLEIDGWACVDCGAAEFLQVHHDPPVIHYGAGCGHHQDRLVTVCDGCHLKRHGKRLRPRQLSLIDAA